MTVVIEGDVIGTSVILPPSKDEKLNSLARLTPEQQVEEVTTMLVQSHAGLLVAIAAQDLPGIAEAKARAATIAEIVKQVRMGKDMQLNASEFCRRAERGLGVAIREGQARGTVATPTEVASRAGMKARGVFTSGQNATPPDTDFAERSELSGNYSKGQFGIYGMTDNVTDAQFDTAITTAREEGNLSRANVARKCKASNAVREDDPLIDADITPKPEPPRKRRLTKHDSAAMLSNINEMLNGIVQTIPFIDPDDISAQDNAAVIRNIHTSMGAIRKLLKGITQ